MTANDAYDETRLSLHGLAELVVAGPRFRVSGDLRLRVLPGGFGTWAEPTVAVEGTELVHPAGRVPLDGTTYDEVARAAGLEATRLDDVYAGGVDAQPGDRVAVDPGAARTLLDALAVGDAALAAFAPDAERVLWPEHFDVAVTVAEVNYGVSPGDAFLGQPYAYVGPHHRVEGAFWDAPFGAARPLAALGGPAVVADFFREGARLAAR